MSDKYSLEGHKPRATPDDEDTELFTMADAFGTLEEAEAKAKERLEKEDGLGLTVIYKKNPLGEREGLKFMFKDKEGKIQEADLYWGNWECREC